MAAIAAAAPLSQSSRTSQGERGGVARERGVGGEFAAIKMLRDGQ
ncbi:hypothetical protein EBME_1318 [bacterium endosymbiont of Mortierella elongata FMR23-6]|nr:hypothetical protein EBME_1318 [bacterium endosymbiont of Mortierella elongata FMR23-6]